MNQLDLLRHQPFAIRAFTALGTLLPGWLIGEVILALARGWSLSDMRLIELAPPLPAGITFVVIALAFAWIV